MLVHFLSTYVHYHKYWLYNLSSVAKPLSVDPDGFLFSKYVFCNAAYNKSATGSLNFCCNSIFFNSIADSFMPAQYGASNWRSEHLTNEAKAKVFENDSKNTKESKTKSASWHEELLRQQRPPIRAQTGQTETKLRPAPRRRHCRCTCSHSHSSALFPPLFQRSSTQWHLVTTTAAKVYSKQRERSVCNVGSFTMMSEIFSKRFRNSLLKKIPNFCCFTHCSRGHRVSRRAIGAVGGESCALHRSGTELNPAHTKMLALSGIMS